jgi:UDP-N-acetylglucosamine 4,6-dehydratase/5-epimerase
VIGVNGALCVALIRRSLQHLQLRCLVALSQDELKQYELRYELGDHPKIRWFLACVRDRGRLTRSSSEVDSVVHADAMKQVDAAEYNPFECIATNVMGAENVNNAATDAGVQRVLALPTDKASSPISLVCS